MEVLQLRAKVCTVPTAKLQSEGTRHITILDTAHFKN